MGQKYTSVSVPNDLLEKIDKIVDKESFGYRTRSEFIKESIRFNILRVNKLLDEPLNHE